MNKIKRSPTYKHERFLASIVSIELTFFHVIAGFQFGVVHTVVTLRYALKFDLTYPIPTCGKDENRTTARWKTSEVIVMIKLRNHVLLHLSVFGNFQEPFSWAYLLINS